MKMYKYTWCRQDGTIENLPLQKKMEYGDALWKSVGNMLECIPADYWPEVYNDKIEYWGDEEGRFNENNHRNPFFKVLKGNPDLGEAAEWDVVGDILREEEV